MPEAHALYAVVGIVIVGLVAWVAIVLKTAKEPWGRPPPLVIPSAGADPDATAQATAVNVPPGPPPAPEPPEPPPGPPAASS